jgi:hypothetical protein
MPNLSGVVAELKKERERAAGEVKRIDAALAALGSLQSSNNSSGRKRQTLSLAARRKIAAAQRARWAKVKKAA